jgi:hypothetical protein
LRKLTDHKINPVNDRINIYVTDEPGHGGANHEYKISYPGEIDLNIPFQKGPISENGVNGVTQEALIAICIDRLRSFQNGPYSCRENSLALTKLEEAQHWLHSRTLKRVARGVEGTHKL